MLDRASVTRLEPVETSGGSWVSGSSDKEPDWGTGGLGLEKGIVREFCQLVVS